MQRLSGGRTHRSCVAEGTGQGEMILFQDRQRQWNGLVAFSWGQDTRSSPASMASMVAFPSNTKGCSCSACCFLAKSLMMHFPHTFQDMFLLTPSKASSASSFCYHRLSLSPARLTKQSASLLTTVSLWNPSWAAGGVEGRSKQDGRASNPPFPLGALTPGQCVPQKLCGLACPFSLLVHLCFFCHNPQHLPVHIQKADILSRRAR